MPCSTIPLCLTSTLFLTRSPLQWHPEQPRSITSITAHTACVYAAMWSPHSPDLIATACGDGHLRLFDLRTQTAASPVAGPAPVMTVPVGGEVLTCDWNKYRPMTIATGSTDKSIKVWDLRSVQQQQQPQPGAQAQGQITAVCTGHGYAVRRIAFSVSFRLHRSPYIITMLTFASILPLSATLPFSLGICVLRHVRTRMGH